MDKNREVKKKSYVLTVVESCIIIVRYELKIFHATCCFRKMSADDSILYIRKLHAQMQTIRIFFVFDF